jgi:hypothetical protein
VRIHWGLWSLEIFGFPGLKVQWNVASLGFVKFTTLLDDGCLSFKAEVQNKLGDDDDAMLRNISKKRITKKDVCLRHDVTAMWGLRTSVLLSLENLKAIDREFGID